MSGALSDTCYMQRCIDLAKQGIRHTFTNPMVGCVIVHENRILGEGYHQKFGEQHAEVNALNNVKEQDKALLPYSIMYVSLEPCSHIGKTPACAHRIVKEGIKNIVIGCTDPNPIVAGRGIKYLQDNGLKVTTHLLENECQQLLKKFKANLEGIPYIILKWAKSSDNFISKHHSQTWLSNDFTRVLTHKWRSETEGIMVGKNTALIDNPSLDVRHYNGTSPLRILMDTHLNVDHSFKLLADGRPTMIVNSIKESKEENITFLKVDDLNDCHEVMQRVFKQGITSVMIEGGASLLNSFISNNCWHEARVINTNVQLKDGVSAPLVEGKLENTFEMHGNKVMIINNQNI